MMEILEDSITSSETFEYLGKFRSKHRDIIERRKAIFGETGSKDA